MELLQVSLTRARNVIGLFYVMVNLLEVIHSAMSLRLYVLVC